MSDPTGSIDATSGMSDQNTSTAIPLKPGLNEIENLVPPGWVGQRKGRGATIVGYEVQGLPSSLYNAPIAAADLKDVRVFFWKGEIGYREDVKVTRFWIDEQGRFNVVEPEPTTILKTPQGVYALFISPFTETPGTNAGELIAQERIDVAAGLLGSFQGRNVVYRKIYANTYSFETQRASASSEAIPVPISFPSPVLTPEGLRPLLAAEKAIWSLPEPERNRVHLSLKWLHNAMFDSGVNAFLKYWFALETIAMPSTTDIGTVNEILCNIYALGSRGEANSRFHTGLLFGVRSRIVHDGKIVPVDGRILRYVEYLYHDILLNILKLPAEKRLEALVLSSAYDYATELRKLAQA